MARRGESRQSIRRRARGGFLLGVVVGLVLGLGIALGVAFYLNKTPIPFSARAKPDAKDGAEKPGLAGMPQGGSQLPTFAAVTPPEKPRYDFYKILPGGDEPSQGKPAAADPRAPAPSASAAPPAQGTPRPGVTNEPYFIQVGSFQNPADADNHKAQLAIIGLESSVEPTTLPEKGTWYRVRIGPFTKLEDINRVRRTLAQNGIKSTLVKAKTGEFTRTN
ncbi:MAG: SPOR domain-containing protein [Burkholderiales bacterium]|nr:SPOR domain-containing protein [Burkholderiales bacterium]